ncbi:hypothetical protein LTS17_000252 [Exophiala oligosperma]
MMTATAMTDLVVKYDLKTLVLFGVVLAYLGYQLSLLLYNAWFHPLRKIPGPFFARTTRLWATYWNRQGRRAEQIQAAHQRYGPIVRVGPNQVSFADPDAIPEIYNNPSLIKDEKFYSARRMFREDHTFAFRDPEAHRQRRKLLSRGFSQASMFDFEPVLTTKIETLLRQWSTRTKDGSPIDVYPWCHWLGFDAVYHLMFDQDAGSLKAGEPSPVMAWLRAWRPMFIYKEIVPQLEQWGVYVPGPIGDNFRRVRDWKNYSVELIRNVRKTKVETPFLRGALAEKDGRLGRPLNDSELAEECMGGMFGGSGTTANTFLFLIYAVCRDPRVYTKLKQELAEAIPDPKTIPSYTMASKLPYLSAVINEALRRHPTIVATLPREAKETVVVQGMVFPKGTILGTQNYTVHRDSKAFPDPELYLPERWLDEDKEQQKLMKAAFNAFGNGSRKCIGIK